MNNKTASLDNPFDMPEYVEGENLEARALADLMKTSNGRTFVWSLLQQSKLFGATMYANEGSEFEKGRRSIGVWVLQLLDEVDPTSFHRMGLEVGKIEQRRRANEEREAAEQHKLEQGY